MPTQPLRALLTLAALLWTLAAPARELVLVGPPWPPYLDPERDNQGFANEIVLAALQAAGYPDIKVKLEPWRRVLWDAQNSVADGLIGIWYAPEREKLALFSEPYFVSPIMAILPADTTLQPRSPKQLAGLRVAHREGARFGAVFDDAREFEHVPVSTTANVLNMVARGRVDAGVEDGLIAEAFLRAEPEARKRLRLSEHTLLSQPLHFGVIRGRPHAAQLVEDFNRGLHLILDNGVYRDILREHGLLRFIDPERLANLSCADLLICQPEPARP
ncbi:transporter substrate-binding domain-containing protein [Marinobacteraceae bacterium S3BR75-40.1]